jgi:CDP-glycerol glycerophosphotransferase (TagB/SpsB family)
LLWKAFYETDLHKGLAKRYSKNKGSNVEVTGYPGTDSLVYGKREGNGAWKKTGSNLKRIIWAPHWSVVPRGNGRPSASNFLEISGFMLELAEQYKNEIQIAFKPHPYLKSTLYNYEGWGKENTEAYYSKWDGLKNGQLETGNYTELFNGSDAMIHDSISFIAEYLYCGKPSLFLKSDPEVNRRFNDFGNLALDHHYHGSDKEDIVQFIEKTVLKGADTLKSSRDDFYNHVLIQKGGKTASQNIYEVLCREIFEE